MTLRIRTFAIALGLALAAGAVSLAAASQAQEGAPLAEPSKSLYWEGHEALGRSDWESANETFRELERQLAGSKTEPTDAAIYWQAYALTHARRLREAEAQIERLRRDYPRSTWLDDAESLSARVTSEQDAARNPEDRAGRGTAVDAREADALMALDALLAGGNQKAVPLLQKVLAGDHSDRVKGRAIFVLSQIDPTAAEGAIEVMLAGNAPPRLKAEAIRMVAAGGRPESLDRLLPVYRDSVDVAIKRSVLEAFLIGDRSDLMLQVIRSESDQRRRRDAIQKLGAMGKDEDLKSLYASLTDSKDRRAVLQSLGVADAQPALIDIARRESDLELRAAAIRAIGIGGGKDATTALVEFYSDAQRSEIREAVIEALMIADQTGTLVALYRKETDPELKRQLLNRIAASDSDAALELIDQTQRR
jgi:HEAT repeat protein